MDGDSREEVGVRSIVLAMDVQTVLNRKPAVNCPETARVHFLGQCDRSATGGNLQSQLMELVPDIRRRRSQCALAGLSNVLKSLIRIPINN